MAKTPYKIRLFGIGRDCPEPPSLGSTPGHPNKIRLILQDFWSRSYALRSRCDRQCEHVQADRNDNAEYLRRNDRYHLGVLPSLPKALLETTPHRFLILSC